KSPQETFTKWDREKILSDVVWVIRKFQPDVIVTRFPTTGEGGHGQHTASAMLAVEAFSAAADPKRFPEQLTQVQPWQAKRILWNTFNFGSTNTTSSDQFQIDVGGFNPVLGKSYGEIAAESRSQHKSQGFGVARARGEATEYFKTIGGDAPVSDLFSGVQTSWARINGGNTIEQQINAAIASFDFMQPQKSLLSFVMLYNAISNLPQGYWRTQKQEELKKLIEQASGMWVEAFINEPFVTQGDSMKVNLVMNDRLGVGMKLLSVQVESFDSTFNTQLRANRNFTFSKTLKVYDGTPPTQPYWLQKPMQEGYFEIPLQVQVGQPDVEPAFTVAFRFELMGQVFSIYRPLKYKSVDQVKGELYQPVTVLPPVSVNTNPNLLLLNLEHSTKQNAEVQVTANKTIPFKKATIGLTMGKQKLSSSASNGILQKNAVQRYNFEILPADYPTAKVDAIPTVRFDSSVQNYLALASIRHDHIPYINYFYTDWLRLVPLHLTITQSKIGYIVGAGDKVPAALEQMGYDVTLLTEKELERNNLKQFDAIISGVRAFNANEWMGKYYDKLMKYVEEGGNYIVQYSQNNNIRSKVGPYNFTVSNKRITDENAAVTFLKPEHPALNFPNKITQDDFKGWVQERSIYHGDNWDSQYEAILGMNDPGEAQHNGSLLVTKYGKGFFTYTGLVFFRELPAGVPGAYRLLANLIALNKIKGS
ncbi:MAG: PIG-L family deacetylase, partial [Chitinophagaceae bacterium]